MNKWKALVAYAATGNKLTRYEKIKLWIIVTFFRKYV